MRIVSHHEGASPARTDDPASSERDRRILSHLALARHLAGRFSERGETREDLDQVAYLGLVKASDRFDPAVGVTFGTYAADTIIGELRRHLRDRRWALHAPRSLRELAGEVNGAVATLTQELGRSPTIREVAHACGREPSDVLAALEVGHATWHSLVGGELADDPVGGRLLATERGEDAVEALDAREELWSRLSLLSAEDRRLLELRFTEELTQSEIARRLHTSQVQVSRELRRVLQSLRMAYRGEP